ncbi:succinyldiaminopimelate transaminase [Polaromonas sp. JS666]|uniref:succinyldiaminopimelate transaminase n=1 Tax=Polaromonas sp. (strain JS666 / ATCC BAA-500) TaxID=296591 RepID=UPI000046454A|nr:succinyldiaminopimelate transaminase [Polaromonas sp. JS666]ABE43927.1 succinyldiaminopimelate aminotransferase apoenzyme [Polaromonas sp. JS666]
MNPLLSRLQPYPFERLRQLHAGVTPNPAYRPISLGIGEPRHATPQLVKDALTASLSGLASYPGTLGEPKLRQAMSDWLARRYGLSIDPATQILPVNGSREALFSLAQTVLDASKPGATVVCPNPFYQIYEGAALLGGAQTWFAPSDPARNFAVDWAGVPETVWAKTQLVFVCSPGNPTGAVMSLAEWELLFKLSDRYGFVIASDECYSEIYFREGDAGGAPLGGLQAAAQLGRHDFKNLISLTSLSKRSNVPGLRSGFVAGDAALIKPFLLYRTYHGSAMSPVVQAASIAAWNDEQHVVENRALYREKFARVTPLLASVMEVALPDAGFYLWAGIPDIFRGSDTEFSRELLALYNVVVLPGSYLARDAQGHNPGAGRIRMALVAETAECVEAAERIVQFIQSKAR